MSNEQAQVATSIPVVEEVRPYFEAALEGRLLVMRCNTCGQHYHYPRSLCPHCGCDRTGWTQASGCGSIYSYAVTKNADGSHHVLAYVTLDDCRVTMLTNIVTDQPTKLHIGAGVKAVFRAGRDGLVLPMFELAVQDAQATLDKLVK